MSKEQTYAYLYFLSMHMVVANGEVSALRRIKVGEKLLWSGEVTDNTTLSVYQPMLFGGPEKEGGIFGSIPIKFGRENQPTINGYGSTGIAYLGVFSVLLDDVYVGTSPYLKYWAFDIETNFSQTNPTEISQNAIVFFNEGEPIGTTTSKIGTYGDMNPAYIIYAILTSKDYGLGYSDSDLDRDSFLTAKNTFISENFGLSFQWTYEQSVEDFLQEIIRHIDGALFIHPLTGLFTLKLMRHDYPDDLVGVPVFDEDNIIDVTKYDRPAIGETVTEVIVSYVDGMTGKSKPVKRRDSALFAKQGYNVTSTVDLPGVSNFVLADTICQKKLHSLGAPLASVEFEANRDASMLGIGDVINWSWDAFGVTSMVLRVIDIQYGSSDSNAVKVTCIQDIFSISNTVYQDDTGTEWEEPASSAMDVTNYRIEELPYALMFPKGAAIGYEQNPINSSQYIVMLEAPVPDSTETYLLARLSADSDTEFDQVDVGPASVVLELSRSMTYSDTNLYYNDVFYASNLAKGDILLIENEMVKITKLYKTEKRLVVTRGIYDTRSIPHRGGTKCFGILLDANDIVDPNIRYSGETVQYKILTSTGTSVLDESMATTHAVSPLPRQQKPYAPGRPIYAGSNFGGMLSAVDLTNKTNLSWTSRNRLTQSDLVVSDTNTTTYVAEAGTTYPTYVRDYLNRVDLSGYFVTPPASLTNLDVDFFKYLSDYDLPAVSYELGSYRSTNSFQTSNNQIQVMSHQLLDNYTFLVNSLGPTHHYKMTDSNPQSYVDTAYYIPYLKDSVYEKPPIHGEYFSAQFRSSSIIPCDRQLASEFKVGSKAIIYTHVLPPNNNANSICFWFNLTATGSLVDRQYLYHQLANTDVNVVLSVYVRGARLFVERGEIGSTPIFDAYDITFGTTYFFAYTDNGTSKLYIDGVLIQSKTRPSISTNGSKYTCIGSSPFGATIDVGIISHITSFDKALTALNISDLYNAGTSSYTGSAFDDLVSVKSPTIWLKMSDRNVGHNTILAENGSATISPYTYCLNGDPDAVKGSQDSFSPYVSGGKSIVFGNSWAGSTKVSNPNMISRIILAHNENKPALSNLGNAGQSFTINFFCRSVNPTFSTSIASTWAPQVPLFYLGNAANSSATKVIAAFGLNNDNGFIQTFFGCKNDSISQTFSTRGSRPINLKRMHMFSIVVDNSAHKVSIYVDGHLDSVGSYFNPGSSLGGNVYSSIASFENPTLLNTVRNCPGQFANFSICPSALTAEQLRLMYGAALNGIEPSWGLESNLPAANTTFSNGDKTATKTNAGHRLIRTRDSVDYASRFSFSVTANVRPNTTESTDECVGITYGMLGTDTLVNKMLGSATSNAVGLTFTGRPYKDEVFSTVITDLALTTGESIQVLHDGYLGYMFARKSDNIPVLIHGDLILEARKVYAAISIYDNTAQTTIDPSGGVNPMLRGFTSLDGSNASSEPAPPSLRMIPHATGPYNGGAFTFNNTMFHKVSGAEGQYAQGFLSTSRSSGVYCFEFRLTHNTSGNTSVGISSVLSSSTTLKVGDAGYGVGYKTGIGLSANGNNIAVPSDAPKNEWIMFSVDFSTRTVTLASATIGSYSRVLTVGELPSANYYPSFSCAVRAAGIEFNMGDRPYVNTKPVGATSWDGT